VCVSVAENCIKEEDEDFVQLLPNCNPCDDNDGNEFSNSCRVHSFGTVPFLCAKHLLTHDSLKLAGVC